MSGSRTGAGSQGGKVKFSDWMKTNDKKSNISALAKLVRADSDDSEDNQNGNDQKKFFTQQNTV